MDDRSWSARAHQYSMYGFTDMPSVEDRGTIVLTRGEGPYVFDTQGRKWLDSNSGLWNMVAGFDHPGLIEAAKAQYDRFPGYHAFFGRMSDQTVMLSEKLVEVSPMRQIASVQTISGAGFRKLFSAQGFGSGWVGETAPRPQTSTPQFGHLDYTPGEIYANPGATQQMLDDAAINLEQWIASEIEAEFAYQEGIAFVAGDGVNKPSGVLTYAEGGSKATAHPWGAIPTITAESATAITADELIDLVTPDLAVLGTMRQMDVLRDIMLTGTSATRQRAVRSEVGSDDPDTITRAVVTHLIEEFHADL